MCSDMLPMFYQSAVQCSPVCSSLLGREHDKKEQGDKLIKKASGACIQWGLWWRGAHREN